MSSFPLVPRAPREPTLLAADQRRRDAVQHAIRAQVPGMPKAGRAMAAAVLDVLWSVSSYERLLTGWELSPGSFGMTQKIFIRNGRWRLYEKLSTVLMSSGRRS